MITILHATQPALVPLSWLHDRRRPILPGASAASRWVMAFNIFDELKERGKGGKR